MNVPIQRKPRTLLAQTLRIRGYQADADGSTATNEITTAVERAA